MYIYVYTHVFINVSSYSHIYKRFVPEGYLRKWISQQGQCIIPVNDLIRQTSFRICIYIYTSINTYIYIYICIYIYIYINTNTKVMYMHKDLIYIYT